MFNYLRKEKRTIIPGEWRVYDHNTRQYLVYDLPALKQASATLPLICKDIIEKGDALSTKEQRLLVTLADLSMQVWGGGPKQRLPHVHINDYFSAFFIQMVKYLKTFDRSKAGAWVSRCRFIGFDTCNGFFADFEKQRKLKEALDGLHRNLVALYPEAYGVDPEDDEMSSNLIEMVDNDMDNDFYDESDYDIE